MPDSVLDLVRFGPDSDRMPVALDEARAFCRRVTCGHYENFHVGSLLLPRRLRVHFEAVYAYCRWADDLADEVGSAAESLRLLDWWSEELQECYAGRAWHPIFVALRPTIDEFEIPVEPFADLLSAFRQDQVQTEYASNVELLDYCRRSADPVGRLVLFLARRHRSELLTMSDGICTGLQLANHWQDVARDFDNGRVYLPRADRERFGYPDEDLRGKRFTPEFRDLMEYEVANARYFLDCGKPLAREMPGRLKVEVDLFRRGGLKILEKIERQGYDVWSRRPVVGKRDAAGLLLRSTSATLFSPLVRLFSS